MSNAKPMPLGRRLSAYRSQTGRDSLTVPQMRQVNKTIKRADARRGRES